MIIPAANCLGGCQIYISSGDDEFMEHFKLDENILFVIPGFQLCILETALRM